MKKKSVNKAADAAATNNSGPGAGTETASYGNADPDAEKIFDAANADRGAGTEAEVNDNANANAGDGAGSDAPEKIIAELTAKLAESEARNREYLDRWQRSAAEFENYKRRTQNEMERMYTSSAADVIASFLPVADSVERAAESSPETADTAEASGAANAASPNPYREGLALIERQIKDTLRKLDVKPLPGVGEQFDPKVHEAIMHFEDASLGQNVVAEVFQKGYMYKDKVVRHSMVKVAN